LIVRLKNIFKANEPDENSAAGEFSVAAQKAVSKASDISEALLTTDNGVKAYANLFT
jgi:hypothetical protein